ncbi:hypothetical protein ACEQ8H_008378 [Pleosporales sp. CAS-2024a]
MPAISPLPVRSAADSSSPVPLQVVCAFPVSGQYGPGSRILYYVLVITCIFARKAEWLRGACLAAALIFPAVAAIHSLVLASTHVNGAVDMDIFGAFQFCSIAILAAPLTVRLSKTYFYDPGRNVIFLWTILLLMGLVALCVEFYRATSSDCTAEQAGVAALNLKTFPYGNATCALRCDQDLGPFSPLRGGANNEIYVIPVPTSLTFNAAMLLAAGFCIPAILGLIFTWDKILEINWKRRRESPENLNEPVEGANVTVGELKGINSVVRKFLSVIEIPVFGGAVIATLCIGEANFFSRQVVYQTEPIAAIGQWAPIAGTVIAALGSLYLLWYQGDKTLQEKPTMQQGSSDIYQSGLDSDRDVSPTRISGLPRSSEGGSENNGPRTLVTTSNDIGRIPTITGPGIGPSTTAETFRETDDDDEPTAGRPRVRQWFTSAANYLGNAAHQKLDVSDYKDQKAHTFPEIPGEPLRNAALNRISIQYDELRKERLRAQSTYAASIVSTSGLEGVSTSPNYASPRPEQSPVHRPKRSNTLDVPPPAHLRPRTETH